MNIFFLSNDPYEAAKWCVDRHVTKIVIEGAQVICNVFHAQGLSAPYKQTHKNHPISLWVGKSRGNFDWVLDHAYGLSDEYTLRYGKIHKTLAVLDWCRENAHRLVFECDKLMKFPQAMPDEYRREDSVAAYRAYYIEGKKHLHKWKLNRPHWIPVENVA